VGAKLAGGLLRLGLAVGLGLALAELLIRWIAPQPLLLIEPGLYEPDPPGRYRLAPGYQGRITNLVEFDHAVSVDARGLRESGRAGGDVSVLTLGDSFTFGMGVPDALTFTGLLAERLGATALNGGLPGTGVPDLVGWYERHGRSLEPDTVVLAVFVGNDLADARPDREEIRIVDGLVSPADTPSGTRTFFHRSSHLVRLLRTAAGSPAMTELRGTLDLSEPWRVRNLRWELSIYAIDPPPGLVAAEAATDRAIGRLASLCAEDGTTLAAVLIPALVQLVPEDWEAALRSVGLDPADHDPDRPAAVFERILDRQGVARLDLAPAFAAAIARGERVYYRLDRHWNEAGHALGAGEMARFLAGSG
jgi:hypothetical protein